MTILVFGKGDRIAIQEPTVGMSTLGVSVIYTNPTYDVFYSRYGFCIPVEYEGVPIEYLIDDLLPSLGEFESPEDTIHRFVMITPDAKLFKVLIDQKDGGSTLRDPILNKMDSWWIAHGTINIPTEGDLLLGYLSNDPSEEDISEFFSKYNFGVKIRWYSVSEIAENCKKFIEENK